MLSPRETEVLECAAEGMTAMDTAQALRISPSTVHLYILHARRKLNAKNKAEAVAKFRTSPHLLTRDAP